MKTSFACSLICHNGIIGGRVHMEESAIVYKTNKLTVDAKYKNLILPFGEVSVLSWKWILFPIATLQMTSGESYRLIIFNKRGFNRRYAEYKGQ